MAFDLILGNARLADGDAASANVDIAISDGRIAAIGPGISGDGKRVDACGRFVSPGLVESHFHLDKALIVDRCEPPKDRRTGDHMSDRCDQAYFHRRGRLRARPRDARSSAC